MVKIKLKDVLEDYITTLKLKYEGWVKPGTKPIKFKKRLNYGGW